MVNIKCENNVSEEFLEKNYRDYDEIIISLDFSEETFKNWLKYVQKFGSKPNRPKIHCIVSFGMHGVGFADLGHFTFDGFVLFVNCIITCFILETSLRFYQMLRQRLSPKEIHIYR